MKKIILISIVLVSLFLLSGCKKDVYGCDIKGHTVKDIELCKAIYESEMEHYESGKLVGRECGDEIQVDIYEQAKDFYIEKYSEDFKENCLLIVTEGEKPKIPLHILLPDKVFPIRTLDLEKDQIEAYGNDFNGTQIVWKYWMVCGR